MALVSDSNKHVTPLVDSVRSQKSSHRRDLEIPENEQIVENCVYRLSALTSPQKSSEDSEVIQSRVFRRTRRDGTMPSKR